MAAHNFALLDSVMPQKSYFVLAPAPLFSLFWLQLRLQPYFYTSVLRIRIIMQIIRDPKNVHMDPDPDPRG